MRIIKVKFKMFIMLFMLIIIMLFCLSVNINAIQAFPSDNQEGDLSEVLLESQLLNNNKLYSAETIVDKNSISLQRENKSFIYKKGEVYVEDSSIYLKSDKKLVDITIFNWYYLDYDNGYVYAADVLTGIEQPEKEMIAGVFMFPANSYLSSSITMFGFDFKSTNILELFYTSDDAKTAYKVLAEVDNDTMEMINKVSQYHIIDEDYQDIVSETLTASFSFENMFKMSMYDDMSRHSITDVELSGSPSIMSLPSYGNFVNSNLTVLRNAYDKFTDTDGYIKEYMSTYSNKGYGYYGVTNTIIQTCDSPIVNVIPKSLFRNRGIYSYIGKEYGFYIKTVQDYGLNNISDFIVFDITTVQPYPGRLTSDPAPSVKIRPLFKGSAQYRYDYGIVFDELYSDNYLGLANIQVAGSINNLYEKNIGDTGYNPNNDYGYAFNSLHYEAKGVGIRRDSHKINLEWAKTAFGAAKMLNYAYPGVGTAVSIIGRTLTSALQFQAYHYREKNRVHYEEMDKLADGTYNVSKTIVGNANTDSMISEYGNLIKGFETELLNSGKNKEEEYPLLYKTSDHYFFVQYNFCQKNSSINWDSLVAIEIALDIYRDDTGYILFFIKTGSCTKMDSVTGGRVDYYNERPSNSNGGTVEESTFYHTEFISDPNGVGKHSSESYVPKVGSYKDFYFTPNRSHKYVIETMNKSPNADPYIKIYDSDGNRIAYNDDGGSYYGNATRNSRIEITLTEGQTYRLRTLCYNYKVGAFEFIIRKAATLNEGDGSSINANSTYIVDDAIWYVFTPSKTEFYTFYTTGTTDTYLTIYDAKYNQYAYDDDSGPGLNALIDIYLIAGRNYYIKAHCYAMRSGSFNLFVNKQKLIQIEEALNNTSYDYSISSGGSVFFRFTPSTTRAYTFFTTSNIGDPVMYLYNENMTYITQNDNGNGKNDARITYTMQAGKTYYIRIVDKNNATCYGGFNGTY